MRKYRAVLIFFLSLPLFLLFFTPPSAITPIAAQLQLISLNPNCGPPGTTVTVTGLGWLFLPLNQDLNLYWDSTSGRFLGSIPRLNQVSWVKDVVVPADATAGVHSIIAVRGSQSASAPFTVPCAGATATPTPPPAETPTPPPTATTMPTLTKMPTVTPSSTAEPGIAIQYLPVTFNNYIVGEPNDTCAQAYSVTPNRLYRFLPDDKDDWYRFTLADSGELTVELTNFTPLAGQIVVWQGQCSGLTFLGNNGDFEPDKTVDLGMQPAGSYYIWLITDGALSDTEPYQLIVRFH